MNIFAVNQCPYISAASLHDKHVVKMILESAQMVANAIGRPYGLSLYPLYTKRNDNFTRFHFQCWLSPLSQYSLLFQVNGFDAFHPFGKLPFSERGYAHHPCTVWVRERTANLNWLIHHGLGLCQEYTKRYGRKHSLDHTFRWLVDHVSPDLEDYKEHSEFARAMPDGLKFDDSIDSETAYRYYLSRYKYFYLAPWKRGTRPSWSTEFYLTFDEEKGLVQNNGRVLRGAGKTLDSVRQYLIQHDPVFYNIPITLDGKKFFPASKLVGKSNV